MAADLVRRACVKIRLQSKPKVYEFMIISSLRRKDIGHQCSVMKFRKQHHCCGAVALHNSFGRARGEFTWVKGREIT